jgi:hypothetical protein
MHIRQHLPRLNFHLVAFDRPVTPPSPRDDAPSYDPHPQDLSDSDEAAYNSQTRPRKKAGGYDSRIEQILYEQPNTPILITDAGKSNEGGSGYIVYTIRTGDLEVRRRYSEFASLRATLVNMHPTLIVPPIPEKHSMADYAAKPTKAKEDVGVIELRKRMLAVFLNRCRSMREVREDGVWWRFLDPNASWNEVLHSAPVATIPKNNMKAPPLDPANPTPAHQWLPVPSANAKLKSSTTVSSTGTPTSPPDHSILASSAAHTIPGPQIFGRFPPTSQNLSEPDLDPYFHNFESSTRELEILLQGNIEKVNRRTLSHLTTLSIDMSELGARYNGFSLSEQSLTVAAAIERVGQAVDSSYIATEELASSLGAGFAEPMRESAQFASVVRGVLRYRILKRVQEEMTRDELQKKRVLLDSLERSESEAKRIEQYLNTGGAGGGGGRGQGRISSAQSATAASRSIQRDDISTIASTEDSASIDSDFPPTHADLPSSPAYHDDSTVISPKRTSSAAYGSSSAPAPSSSSSGSVANKILNRISHAVHGVVDVDPERTRRDQIGKTRESLVHLEQALEVVEKDVRDASTGVMRDLKRFQGQKEGDLRRYMVSRMQSVTWT